jgi:hypothetical protein
MLHALRPTLLTLATLGLGALAGRASAPEPEAFDPAGFRFRLETEVPVPPEAAWDGFTGDVSPWWDHHFVPQPLRLEIGRTPGSSFVEIFDEAGHGAEHARVTHAVRGQLLRLCGPLGLVGHGVEIDAILRFAAAGEGTKVSLQVYVHGRVNAEVAAAVESVWRHFLIDRYTPHLRDR